MSARVLYDQLTSEMASSFQKEAAQYAVDNKQTQRKRSCKSKELSRNTKYKSFHKAIRDQLVSEYGHHFAEADYAIVIT